MRLTIWTSLLALIHFVLSAFLLVMSFGATMKRFETGGDPGALERIVSAASKALQFPLGLATNFAGASRLFPGAWGYALFALNSLLWGAAIALLTRETVRRVPWTTGPAPGERGR
jgi:hypothetical protein